MASHHSVALSIVAVGLVIVSLVGILGLSAYADKEDKRSSDDHKQIKTQELLITNSTGITVWRVFADDSGNPRLEARDKTGETRRLAMGLGANGVAALTMYDSRGEEVCGLLAKPDRFAGLYLTNDKHVIGEFSRTENGDIIVALCDSAGAAKVGMQVADGEAGLVVIDSKGKERIVEKVDKKDVASIRINDKDGTKAHEWRSDK